MNDELLYKKKRFQDLSRQAERRGIATFSDFLTVSEQALLRQSAGELASAYELSGGYEYAERQMAAFLPDAFLYENAWEYPFCCLRIAPSHPKFAEELTHRDVLGALMGLGIEREKLGDVIVDRGNMFVFAQKGIVPYLTENLSTVRRTAVTLTVLSEQNLSYEPHFEEREAIVTSNRLDAVIAAICKISRSASLKLITEGKILINGTESLHNTYYCKQGDILSIRGFGKVRFGEILGTTRKDRLKFSYKLYS